MVSRRKKEIEKAVRYAREVDNEGICPHCGWGSAVGSHVYARGPFPEFAAIPSNIFGLCRDADAEWESGFQKISSEARIKWLRDPRNILEEFETWVDRKLDALEEVVQTYRRANALRL